MKAICPNNENHKKFNTTAHVVQEWVVDESGNFLEELSTLETTHPPTIDNVWYCSECGAEAEVIT
jgi:hypothetical protein